MPAIRPGAGRPGTRLQRRTHVLLLVGMLGFLLGPAQAVTYTTIQQSVEARAHGQTISAARAFLRQFPQSAEAPRVMFWLAEAFYATQAYQEAAKVYEALLQEAPSLPEADVVLHHLGASHLLTRRYSAALAAFARLLEQFPGTAERNQVVLQMAMAYFKQGRFEDALPLYQQLQNASTLPISAAALHLQLAHCYFHRQQVEPAQHHYRQILHHFPASPEAPMARYQLGALALIRQDVAGARQHFQTMLQTYASEAVTRQAHYGLAWIWVYQGQVEQAVTYLQHQHLLAQPTVAEAVMAEGYDLVQLHDYQKAIAVLMSGQGEGRANNQEPLVQWLLAQAYEGLGEVTQAIQILDDFVRRFPQHPRVTAVQAWRGRLLLQERDASETLAAYRAALTTASEDEEAEQLLLQIADLYQNQQALAEAIAIWQRFVHTYPLSPRRTDVHLRIGAAQVRQGIVAPAVHRYRQLLATALPLPLRRQTELQLAWAYLRAHDYDKALAVYDELVQTSHDPEVLRQVRFWQGWTLQRQKRYAASNAAWLALLPLEPEGPRRGEVLWRLGSNLMQLGQCQEAHGYLLDVRTMYASEVYARLATWPLQRCFVALGRYTEALDQAPAFALQEPLAYFKVATRFSHAKRLFDAKQYPQARHVFERIVEQPFVSPLTDDAVFMIAESYLMEGDKRRALAVYRLLGERYGRTNVVAMASYREGMLLKDADSLPAAAQAFQRAAQQASEAAIREQAWYHLGNVYMHMQQRSAAAATFRRLLHEGTTMFTSAADRLHLGLLLQQLAEYAAALQVFQRVAQQATDARVHAEALFWAAETAHLQGDAGEAVRIYQQVAEQFSDQQDWALTALFRAGELYEAAQQYEEAMRMYQRILTATADDRQRQFAAERIQYLKTKKARTASQQG